MAKTRKQRKTLANAKMWAGIFSQFPDSSQRLLTEAQRIDRTVEKRKRQQFRHNAGARP